MRARAGPFLPIAALGLALAACSPGYVFKVWRGHSRLLQDQRPIAEMLADPAVGADLKARLRLAEEVRGFAFDVVGIARSRNYTTYVGLDRPYVTTTVSACRKTAFEAYEWWFPIVGKVPYKGYFDRADAEREKAALESRGWDAHLTGVAAYTTMLWTPDPLLSTITALPPSGMAELILHELTHTGIFYKNQVDFNEAAATFVGEEAAADFLRRRFGPDSPELRQAREDSARDRDFTLALSRAHAELEALYASPLSEEEKLARREEAFARHKPLLRLKALNNAVILAHRRYRHELDDFRRAHERLGRDWPRTIALLRSLDKRRPREALREALAGGTPP